MMGGTQEERDVWLSKMLDENNPRNTGKVASKERKAHVSDSLKKFISSLTVRQLKERMSRSFPVTFASRERSIICRKTARSPRNTPGGFIGGD